MTLSVITQKKKHLIHLLCVVLPFCQLYILRNVFWGKYLIVSYQSDSISFCFDTQKQLDQECTGVQVQNLNMVKKFFLVTSKSETFLYFRLITCKVKHFKRFFVFIYMIRSCS